MRTSHTTARRCARVAALLALAAVATACGDDDGPSNSSANASANNAAPATTTPYTLDLPPGFPAPNIPDDNPLTVEGVALGRHLFYDVRLSGNQTQSCASCHRQELAFTDGLPKSIGSTGEEHPRSSMALVNIAYATSLGWANPLLETPEIQTLVPMFGEEPVELGLAGMEAELLERLRDDPAYVAMFAAAFPGDADPITLTNTVRALSSFVRSLVSTDSPYDRLIYYGDADGMSASARRGMQLFFSERLECFHCHGGFNLADSVAHEGTAFVEQPFHNNGLYNLDATGAYPFPNVGLYEFTADPADQGRFKAPSLRNIAVTAPYMHDGSLATLEDVLDHYASGGRNITAGELAGDGRANPNKSTFVSGFVLTDQEREDVLSFLRSLTDEGFLTDPRHSDPFAQ